MDINDLKRLAGVNEATVNISMTGANSAEISDLMNMFKGPGPKPMSIGGPPPPPPGLDLPDIKPPIGLDKPPAPMSLDGPLPPLPPPKPLGMDDGPAPCDTCGGIHGDEPCGEDSSWDNEPTPSYQDSEHMTNAMSGGINGRKNPKDIRVKDGSSVKESYKKDLWAALQEKYFTEFDGRETIANEVNSGDWIDDDNPCASTKGLMHKICMRRHRAKQKRLQKDSMYSEEQTFSGRSDRTYFIVPNEDDYMDIQDDSRFAGDIEVPDENADIMALPNSKFRKLKMMYGNKILDLGTDYDEAVEREEQKAKRRHLAGISRTKAGGSAGRRSEGMQSTREKELVGKQHKLPPRLKKKIEDAPEDQVNSSQYDEDIGDIRRLSGLNETKKKELNEFDPRKAWNDAKAGIKGAADAVGNVANKAMGSADAAISNLKKNAGIGSQQQQQAAPQPKPDKMVTKPGEVMKWKNPKTGKLEIYIFVTYPKTSINRNAGALSKRVKLGIAADQKTINFKPGEKLQGGVIVQPGTKTELYQNLIKTHVDNARHKMGQKTSGMAGAGTTDLKDAKKWKDMSYEEKKEFYTDQDMAAAKKALINFAEKNPSFKQDLSMALELNKDGDPEMLQKFITMGLEREASSKSGEQAYLASLKQSDIDTGATATNKNGKGPGTTATVDMGKGIGTTATLGNQNMGGVA